MIARVLLRAARRGRAARRRAGDCERSVRRSAALIKLEAPLVRTANRIASKAPLTIVAIGSSSTAGAGASAPQFAYPARLEAELQRMLPGVPVRVVNRGVNGEQAPQMIERFARDVLPEKPDLVIWQVGANTVLRRSPMTGYPELLGDGLVRLRQAEADVIIMDVQYAPRVLANPEHVDMERILDTFTRTNRIGLFRRFAIMRHWATTWDPDFKRILSEDGIHLTDLSYGCVARLLAQGIVSAAQP